MSLRTSLYRLLGRGYRRWALGRIRDGDEWILRRARRLVRAKTYCLVVTGPDEPTARVVEPFPPDDAGRIVFGTDPASRKAEHIRATGRCLLVYQDDRRRACVSVECEATVLTPERSNRFMPMWLAFWPDGPGPDFVNVVCTPTAVELWDGLAVVAPGTFGRVQARVELHGAQHL